LRRCSSTSTSRLPHRPDIGIVEKYLGGGQFQSVEGNTSLNSNSNGGEVMRRVRYLSQVNGFGRVVK